MKKIASLILTICLIFSMFSGIAVNAQSSYITGKCGNLEWSVDFNTKTLSFVGDGIISSYEDGCPWSQYSSQVEKIVINDGITEIGSRVFGDFCNLNDVHIGNTVVNISSSAFSLCESLKSINIPDSVTQIGSNVFYGCDSLETIGIGSGLSSINSYTFRGCTSIKEFIVSENNEEFCSYNGILFNKNKSQLLKYATGNTNREYTVPNSVNSIFGFAFSDSKYLFNLNVPNTVEYIGDNAFYNVPNVNLDGVSEDGYSWGAKTLNGYVDGDLIYSDDSKRQINACFVLANEVNIDSNVTDISANAFQNCTNLKKVNITDLKSWLKIRFHYSEFSDSIRFSNPMYYAKELYLNDEIITDLVIPNGISEIPPYAFYGCDSIKSIYLPSTVDTVNWSSFYNCKNLNKLDVEDIASYLGIWFRSSESDEVYSPLFTARNLYIKGERVEDLVIPEGVEVVNPYALMGADSIKSISIPTTLKVFGYIDLKNLQKIIIPDISTWLKLEIRNYDYFTYPVNMFDLYIGEEKVENITIPNDINRIFDHAFYGCKSLKSVIIPNSVKVIEYNAFWNCPKLEKVEVLNPNCQINNGETFVGKTKLYGYSGSSLEVYANNYNREFYDIEKNCFNHQIGDGVVIKHPSCYVKGQKLYSCENCDYEYIENTVALTHNYYSQTVKATCISPGYTVHTCINCGDVYRTDFEDISENHSWTLSVHPATTSTDGFIVQKCSVCGTATKGKDIPYPKTIKLSKTEYVYNGTVENPTLIIKDSTDKELVNGKDYTVVIPSGRKNVGIYNYKITFIGDYSGTKSLNFIINPKNTSISKLTATKGGFKATIKKYTTQTTGYQIRYSTKSNMSGAKTVTISKNTTTSKTVSSLSKGKKYYVQIRTFKTANGIKYYSDWSGNKTVTTKK